LPDIDSIQSIFEPIFDGHILAESVIATLKLWMPTYLQEIELQRGTERGAIPVPRVYTTRNEFTTFPEDIIPLVIVFRVGVEQVVSKWAGPPHPVPPDPVTQPGSEWPPVEETDVEVLRKEEE
jgi:hypothetical protein